MSGSDKLLKMPDKQEVQEGEDLESLKQGSEGIRGQIKELESKLAQLKNSLEFNNRIIGYIEGDGKETE